jgi:hypothetical protein
MPYRMQSQRDPRLNEILDPLPTTETCEAIIAEFEPDLTLRYELQCIRMILVRV